ncbi:hypothetical protein OS493_024527 [Desmophyllum pertusum]|uniref:Uncharacterized protein n=1 Tax=Desmophyllum pertusum TaxID=174260 RepID=A0A9X0D8A9_9CNID|nr:hypothetical protein OS493_024527 [Desmophyllum pertusum]
MAAGQVGVRGVNALKPVEMDSKTETENVTIQRQNTEESRAPEQADKQDGVMSKSCAVNGGWSPWGKMVRML